MAFQDTWKDSAVGAGVSHERASADISFQANENGWALPAQADEMVRYFSRMAALRWDFTEDGCTQRHNVLRTLMEVWGFRTLSALTENPDYQEGSLKTWDFHFSACVKTGPGNQDFLIIDPALNATRAITPQEALEKLGVENRKCFLVQDMPLGENDKNTGNNLLKIHERAAAHGRLRPIDSYPAISNRLQ